MCLYQTHVMVVRSLAGAERVLRWRILNPPLSRSWEIIIAFPAGWGCSSVHFLVHGCNYLPRVHYRAGDKVLPPGCGLPGPWRTARKDDDICVDAAAGASARVWLRVLEMELSPHHTSRTPGKRAQGRHGTKQQSPPIFSL